MTHGSKIRFISGTALRARPKGKSRNVGPGSLRSSSLRNLIISYFAYDYHPDRHPGLKVSVSNRTWSARLEIMRGGELVASRSGSPMRMSTMMTLIESFTDHALNASDPLPSHADREIMYRDPNGQLHRITDARLDTDNNAILVIGP